MSEHIRVQILIISVIIQLFTITYFLIFARKSKILSSFIVFNVLMIFWNFAYIIEIFQKNSKYIWIFTSISYTAVSFLGVAYFNFVKNYTSDNNKITKKLEKILLISSSIIVLFIWSNPYHNLFYIYKQNEYKFAILYYTLFIQTHIAVFISIARMIKYIKINRLNKNEYYQSIYLIALPLIVSTYNIIHNINHTQKIELTSAIFSILVSIFAILSFKYKFFDYLPLGINKAFDIFISPTVIIDIGGTVIKENQALKALLKKDMNTIDDFISTLWFISNEKDTIKEIKNKETAEQKITIDTKTYMLSKIPMKEKNKTILHIITLTDISHYIQEEKENQIRQIFSNLHDDIGNNLTAISKIQESIIIDIEKNDIERVIKLAEKSYELSTLATKKLRQSVTNIKNIQNQNKLSQKLNTLKETFKIANIEIDIYNEYEDYEIDRELTQILYNISQESITNAIKHGKADKITILIKKSDTMNIHIIDNGIGTKEIKKGNGLNAIADKLKKYEHTLNFISSENNGFITKIIIKGIKK